MPPLACSNRPTRSRSAPVNAPLTWPNSSLSSRLCDRAAQWTLTNGRAARGLAAWIASARSSLPVPLSPRIRTADGAGRHLPRQRDHPPDGLARALDLVEDLGVRPAARPRWQAVAAVGELVLEDQDPPLLLGDLLDLVAQLLVEGLQGLLDARRVQRQRGHRAEGAEERDLLGLVGHAAPLRAEHEQAGERRRRPPARWPPRPPGRSWRRSPGRRRSPAPWRAAPASPATGGAARPAGCRRPGPLVGSRAEAGDQLERPAGPPRRRGRSPPTPAADLGRRLQQPPARASRDRPGCRPPPASSASPGRTCTSRGRTAGRSPSGTASVPAPRRPGSRTPSARATHDVCRVERNWSPISMPLSTSTPE